MKRAVFTFLGALLFAFVGAFLWALWASCGACGGLEWFLEALIMTVALRVPFWVWCLSALAFLAVRCAVVRSKGKPL